MEVHHDIRGDARICIIPENQDTQSCATFHDSFTDEVEVPGVEIGEEVKVCVTNLETDVQDCKTEVNNRGGIDSIELTVPPDPEPIPSPTPEDTAGSGGIGNASETTSEPTTATPLELMRQQLVQGVLIPLLIIIPVVISIILLIRRRRRARPAGSVDFE